MGCWTSSLAHTQISIPPYSPPKQHKLSEKILDYPSTPTAATCNLDYEGTAFFKHDIDGLLPKDEFTSKSFFDGRIELDIDVHPLFAKYNFHGVRYDVVLPSLRLATLLLDTPCLMRYWHAAFFSLQEVPYADIDDPRKTYKAIVHKNTPLTAKEVAHTRLKFRALAQHVRFYVSRSKKQEAGVCVPAEACIDSAACDLKAQRSDIILNPRLYRKICKYHDRHTGDLLPIAQYHGLAVTICHEIAHAIAMSRFGTGTAIGFETQFCAEHGFDWEATVFGGHVEPFGALKLVLHPWPTASIFEDYMRVGGGQMFVQAASVGEVEIAWASPESYLVKLFSKSFWEQLAAHPDPDALKVPHTLGYRWIPAGPSNSCKCANCRVGDDVCKWSIRCGNINKDKSESATSEWSRLKADLANEHPGWTDAELRELTCERVNWGFWPAGNWCNRQYARDAGFDPQTYGVPDGFKSLPDGSITAEQHYEELERYERTQMHMYTRIAELALNMLIARMEGESKEDKKKTVGELRLLGQMLVSQGVEGRYMLCALLPMLR